MLVVDDHPMWRHTLRKVLEDGGFARVVAEASDGQQAIELTQAVRPDVVVMDVHLPALGGCDTTREILRIMPSTRPEYSYAVPAEFWLEMFSMGAGCGVDDDYGGLHCGAH